VSLRPPPTPQEQIHFLQHLQRILSDGSFAATYKFALLHALADLSVIHGEDSRGELTLSTRQIAEQVIELYWRQARPFTAPAREPLVLRQNAGSQAAILNHLHAAMEAFGPSLVRLRQRTEDWRTLVSQVDAVIRKMPLWKLQTVGQDRLDFLYENLDRGTTITLKPGVAYCFRAFHDLILDLIRGAWLRFVRSQNTNALGEVSDLSSFLFGSERVSLALYQPVLMEVQSGVLLLRQGPGRDRRRRPLRAMVALPGRSGPQLRAGARRVQPEQVRSPGRGAAPGAVASAERGARGDAVAGLPRSGRAARPFGIGGDRPLGIRPGREDRRARLASGSDAGGALRPVEASVRASAPLLKSGVRGRGFGDPGVRPGSICRSIAAA